MKRQLGESPKEDFEDEEYSVESHEIYESLKVWKENITHLDEDDLGDLVDIVVSFNWSKGNQEKVKNHLEQQALKKSGPGRPMKKAREKEKKEMELQSAATFLANNDNHNSENIINILKGMTQTITKILNKDMATFLQYLDSENKIKLATYLGCEEFDNIRKSAENNGAMSLKDVKGVDLEGYYDSGSQVLNAFIEGVSDGKKEKSRNRKAKDFLCGSSPS